MQWYDRVSRVHGNIVSKIPEFFFIKNRINTEKDTPLLRMDGISQHELKCRLAVNILTHTHIQ